MSFMPQMAEKVMQKSIKVGKIVYAVHGSGRFAASKCGRILRVFENGTTAPTIPTMQNGKNTWICAATVGIKDGRIGETTRHYISPLRLIGGLWVPISEELAERARESGGVPQLRYREPPINMALATDYKNMIWVLGAPNRSCRSGLVIYPDGGSIEFIGRTHLVEILRRSDYVVSPTTLSRAMNATNGPITLGGLVIQVY